MRYLLLYSILGIFGACGGEQDGKNKDSAKELVLQDSSAYIDSAKLLAQDAQQLLLSTLMTQIAAVGFEGAVPFCHEQALTITKSAVLEQNMGIKRISLKNRNPWNQADDADKAVLLSMENSSKAGNLIPPLFKAGDGEYLVYVPIFLGMPICLGCHGNPDGDIAPATLDAIAQKYPEDKAIGYKTGDFRGAWRISFVKPL
jgi:hypothetical protein